MLQVSKNPLELLNLCKEYNCYPDIWSLHYWSNWLSPITLPKRFDTAFYVAAIKDKPKNIYSSNEVLKAEVSNILINSRLFCSYKVLNIFF